MMVFAAQPGRDALRPPVPNQGRLMAGAHAYRAGSRDPLPCSDIPHGPSPIETMHAQLQSPLAGPVRMLKKSRRDALQVLQKMRYFVADLRRPEAPGASKQDAPRGDCASDYTIDCKCPARVAAPAATREGSASRAKRENIGESAIDPFG